MGERIEEKRYESEQIKDYGQAKVNLKDGKTFLVMSVIGEIEGHECLNNRTKTTKYEHILPQLANAEADPKVDGILFLLNTVGGDVESGLAIAEMIASLSKPTVSLILGGSHSIGVPLAVSTDVSFIVPSGTVLIHPVRMSGMIIGVSQTFDYFKSIQDRIVSFVASHSHISKGRMEELMMNTGMLTKDLGTILIGEQTVKEGLVDHVGGVSQAFEMLRKLSKKANN